LPIRNVNRVVGTITGSEVTRARADGCPTTPSSCTTGSAGQSLARSCRAA
jgi:hypothetical protein